METKIVVVDDDADVRTFSLTVVEEFGAIPLVAENGEEGLELVEAHKPALIIMDVLMPRQSGIKMYRKLRMNKDQAHIPVIVLSGIAEKSFLKSQAVLAEFDETPVPRPEAYLEKPVSPEELSATIRRILNLK